MSELVLIAIITTFPAVVAAIGAWWNGRKIDVVHAAVNGGLDAAKKEIIGLKAEVLRLKTEAEKPR